MLVVTPYGSDANSFWRCIGPMSYFCNTSRDSKELSIEMTVLDETKPFMWNDMTKYDVMFMHRPCRGEDLIMLKLAYNQNIPVWVDFDDWLFGIPGWNPNAKAYMQDSVQTNMAAALSLADIVSVSTTELYNLYSKVNPNVVVVPNSYRTDMFTYRKSDTPRKIPLMWRGSNTHDGDVLSVKQAFQTGLRHKVSFLGDPGWILLSGMKKDSYEMKQNSDVLLYFKFICELAPKVLVFPLVDCLFNRCKSNIAYIEALHAGALCVAPDMPEWRHPGVITYQAHDSESFAEAVNYAAELPQHKHQEMVEEGFLNMQECLDISKTNHIRHQIMSHLLSGTVEKKNPYDQMTALKTLGTLKSMASKETLNGANTATTTAVNVGIT